MSTPDPTNNEVSMRDLDELKRVQAILGDPRRRVTVPTSPDPAVIAASLGQREGVIRLTFDEPVSLWRLLNIQSATIIFPHTRKDRPLGRAVAAAIRERG